MMFVLDTSVLVSALIAKRSATSPPQTLVRSALAGELPIVLSDDLRREYRDVLARPRFARRFGPSNPPIQMILDRLDEVAQHVECSHGPPACPDPGDQHLWDLLRESPSAILVTGEKLLLGSNTFEGRVKSPRDVMDSRAAASLAAVTTRSNLLPLTREIPIDSIRPGPIRHAPEPAWRPYLEELQATFAAVYPISYKSWEEGFRRDLNPEREIATWLVMAERFRKVLCQRSYSLAEQKEIFGMLLDWSVGKAPSKILTSLQHLTPREGDEILHMIGKRGA